MTGSSSRQAAIIAIRQSLTQAMDDALKHDLRLPALHIRIAVMELDEIQSTAMTSEKSDKRRNDKHKTA